MANAGDLLKLIEENFLDFKAFFAAWLNNDIQCANMPEYVTGRMRRLINSIKFWSNKFSNLQHRQMAICTTFSLNEESKTSYSDILKSLSEIIDISKVQEIFVPENKLYIGIFFKDVIDCNYVKENFSRVGEAYVVFVDWYAECLEITGRLHYVPPFANMNKVNEFLAKYLFNLKLEKVLLKESGEFAIFSSVTAFKGRLKSLINMQDIPHFIEIDGNKILITIKGRRPICMRCKHVGHVRRDCKYIYCSDCKVMTFKNHSCEKLSASMSYASALKNNDSNNVDPAFLEDLGFNYDSDDQLVEEQSCLNSHLVERSNPDIQCKSVTALQIVLPVIDEIITQVIKSSDRKFLSDSKRNIGKGNNTETSSSQYRCQYPQLELQPNKDEKKLNQVAVKSNVVCEKSKVTNKGQDYLTTEHKTYSKTHSASDVALSSWYNQSGPGIFSPASLIVKSEGMVDDIDDSSSDGKMDVQQGPWIQAGKRKTRSEESEQENDHSIESNDIVVKKCINIGVSNPFEPLMMEHKFANI